MLVACLDDEGFTLSSYRRVVTKWRVDEDSPPGVGVCAVACLAVCTVVCCKPVGTRTTVNSLCKVQNVLLAAVVRPVFCARVIQYVPVLVSHATQSCVFHVPLNYRRLPPGHCLAGLFPAVSVC